MKYTKVTNPVFISKDGQAIECMVEFDHLSYECPFIARPNDSEAHGKEIFRRALAGDFGPISPFVEESPAVETASEESENILTKDSAKKLVSDMLDEEARARGYDDIISACSYAAGPNPFQKESLLFLEWRGNVWQKFFKIWAFVENGASPTPTREELLSVLPAFNI